MILVTGGTGLLGSKLLRSLIGKGHKVRALCRENSRFTLLDDIKEEIEWIEADVLDIPSLEKAMEGIENVYHCAALVSFNPSKREAMYRINIEGTANIVNVALALNVDKLVHVSSIASLGRVKDGAEIDENTKWEDSNDNSHYSITKYRSEQEVWRGMAEGLKAVIVNPAVILGEGNWKTDSSSFISNVYKGIPFYPVGCNGFVDAEDVVKAMIYLMEEDITNERFILSVDNIFYKDLFFMIADIFGKKKPSMALNLFLGSAIWRLVALFSFFSGKTPVITKETVNTISKKYFYSNEKIRQTGFSFKPIEETVRHCCKAYMNYLSDKKQG